jgi:hypothetical protein
MAKKKKKSRKPLKRKDYDYSFMGTSTDTIQYASRVSSRMKNPPEVIEVDKIVFPCGMKGWVNVYFVVRKKIRGSKNRQDRIGNIMVSVRKYQEIEDRDNPGKGIWMMRNSYNINRPEEVRAIFKTLLTYYPEELQN